MAEGVGAEDVEGGRCRRARPRRSSRRARCPRRRPGRRAPGACSRDAHAGQDGRLLPAETRELADLGAGVHRPRERKPARLLAGEPAKVTLTGSLNLPGPQPDRDAPRAVDEPRPRRRARRRLTRARTAKISTPKETVVRGAMMYGPGDVHVEERAAPRIVEPTDAIIRVSAACVCGSDLWPYPGIGIEGLEWPAPTGHEYAGIVEDVGSEVRTVRPGQFVVGSFWATDNTLARSAGSATRAPLRASTVRRTSSKSAATAGWPRSRSSRTGSARGPSSRPPSAPRSR